MTKKSVLLAICVIVSLLFHCAIALEIAQQIGRYTFGGEAVQLVLLLLTVVLSALGLFFIGLKAIEHNDITAGKRLRWQCVKKAELIYFYRENAPHGPILRYISSERKLLLTNPVADEYAKEFASFSEANSYFATRPKNEVREQKAIEDFSWLHC